MGALNYASGKCFHKGILRRRGNGSPECGCLLLGIGKTLAYLLTPWSRVLLEKLTDSAASQEIPRLFGNRRFLVVPTSARHLSLSWANSIQSPQLPPTSWRSILILSSHLRLIGKTLQKGNMCIKLRSSTRNFHFHTAFVFEIFQT